MANKSATHKLVVLTGAGISAESGLATFRDTNGLWKQYDAKKLASLDGFNENPQAVLGPSVPAAATEAGRKRQNRRQRQRPL